MIAKEIKIKFIMLQCMNEESLNILDETINIVNDIDNFSFIFLNDSNSKNV